MANVRYFVKLRKKNQLKMKDFRRLKGLLKKSCQHNPMRMGVMRPVLLMVIHVHGIMNIFPYNDIHRKASVVLFRKYSVAI